MCLDLNYFSLVISDACCFGSIYLFSFKTIVVQIREDSLQVRSDGNSFKKSYVVIRKYRGRGCYRYRHHWVGKIKEGRKALMLYFSKSMTLMTSVFLCANIRLHTFNQKPGYASVVRCCFSYWPWQPKTQDLIPAFAKEAKFSLI